MVTSVLFAFSIVHCSMFLGYILHLGTTVVLLSNRQKAGTSETAAQPSTGSSLCVNWLQRIVICKTIEAVESIL